MPSSHSSAAFTSPAPLLARPHPRASRRVAKCALRSSSASQIRKVSDEQLHDLIATPTPGPTVIVLKCFASYCRGCKGVESKFRKIAAAYNSSEDVSRADGRRASVKFCEMDFASHEDFCREQLGVQSLPFFGIWSDGTYVGGEAIGWQSVGKKLVERIDSVVTSLEVPTVAGV